MANDEEFKVRHHVSCGHIWLRQELKEWQSVYVRLSLQCHFVYCAKFFIFLSQVCLRFVLGLFQVSISSLNCLSLALYFLG